jgi:predicted TIM-barrel fold metal-dependent hydrolase
VTLDLHPDELFLPEPEPRPVKFTIVSCDDHLIEPPHLFEGRVAQRFRDRAPRIVEDADGIQQWAFDGQLQPNVGGNAVANVRMERRGYHEPQRFSEMRRGCWEPHERVRDMDIGGIWASLNFPSNITGFCGRVYSTCSDPELGKAVTRAWNDWFFEEWYSAHPDRFIPLGITFLTDPDYGADEIRRNAARGFKAVSLPELPERIGLPGVFSGHWDKYVEACAETGTVMCFHIGSSGLPKVPEGPNARKLLTTLFPFSALEACAQWLWSGYAVRFPDLKIAMSEGGIGWVAALIDRLDSNFSHTGYSEDAFGDRMAPSDVLRRNFWFCSILDPSTISTRHAIGIENIMYEVDYPHGDSYWPDCQATIEKYWGDIPAGELRPMLSGNAAELFRHPLPKVVLPETPAGG